MRAPLITAVAAFGLVAIPALAQSINSSSNQSSSNAMQIEQSLKQDLSKAGFTGINIISGSFLVHAKNSKDQPIEMMISLNSVTQITAMGSNSSDSGQSNNNSTSSK